MSSIYSGASEVVMAVVGYDRYVLKKARCETGPVPCFFHWPFNRRRAPGQAVVSDALSQGAVFQFKVAVVDGRTPSDKRLTL
jgi:hypothetical protein